MAHAATRKHHTAKLNAANQTPGPAISADPPAGAPRRRESTAGPDIWRAGVVVAKVYFGIPIPPAGRMGISAGNPEYRRPLRAYRNEMGESLLRGWRRTRLDANPRAAMRNATRRDAKSHIRAENYARHSQSESTGFCAAVLS